MRSRRAACLAAALALAGAWAAPRALAADQVVFNDGNTLEGNVEEETDAEVVVRVGNERRRYPRRLVSHVVRAAAPRPAAAPATEGAPPRTKPADAGVAPGEGGGTAGTSAQPVPAAKEPQPNPKDAKPAPVDELLIWKIAQGTPAERRAAMEVVAAGWPVTRPTVEAALRHVSPDVRLTAMSFLDDARITGASAYVPELLSDASAPVRRVAVRMVRRMSLAHLEPRLIEKVVNDRDPGVRAETLRSLEDVGTVECLPHVLAAMDTERDLSIKARMIRVLRKITGEDCKGDVPAWRAAIQRAVERAAAARQTPVK